MTNTRTPAGITAHIYEDANGDEWLIYAASPLTVNNISPDSPYRDQITPERIEGVKERMRKKGEIFGFTLTDRLFTFDEDFKWRDDRTEVNPDTGLFEQIIYGLSPTEYAMKLDKVAS